MTNKFVSFLEKAGKVIAAGVGIAAEVYPLFQPLATALAPASAKPAIATVGSDISDLSGIIGSVEAVSASLATPLTGAQKAAAAGAQFANIFLNSAALAGKKVANPQAFGTAMVAIASGFADAWNAVDGSELPTITAPKAS